MWNKVKVKKKTVVLKEFDLAQALSTSSDWRCRHSKEAAAKAQLEEEKSALRLWVHVTDSYLQFSAGGNYCINGWLIKIIPAFISQLTELKNQLQLVEEKSRTETKSLVDQLHHLSGENASTNLENQRLKVLD